MQGVLFKVHRYFLQRDSDTFGREFGGAEAEAGRSDVTAFVFSNLDKEEFVALLDFYYYGYVSMRALYPRPMASKTGHRMYTNTLPSTPSQWIKLLSISTQFSFPDLRKRAIFELNNNYTVDPVEIIVLAEACRVPEWKEPAFVDLVRREEFIQYEEAMKLGPKLSHELYVAREEARKNTASVCRRCQGSSTEEPALRNDTTSFNLTTHDNPPFSHPTPQDDPSPSNPKSHDGPSSPDPILHNDPSRSASTSFNDRPSPDPHLYSSFQGSSTEAPAPRNDTTSLLGLMLAYFDSPHRRGAVR